LIAVTSTSFSKNPTLRTELKAVAAEVRFNETGKALQGSELHQFLNGCQAAVVGLEIVDRKLLKACPNLKVISKYGVGLDNLDLEACKEQSVMVGWTAGVNAYAVAEQTLGMILALLRNIHRNASLMRKGEWNKNGGRELRGANVGIIGVGSVGQEVARLVHALGGKLLLNDVADIGATAKNLGARIASKEEIYSECDVISLHIPLIPETKNLIRAETLNQMKRAPILVNTSRGGVVNQTDLKAALKNGKIGGAALDVFDEEPCRDQELLQMENALCTPHTCGNSEQAVLAMGRAAIANLRRLVKL
jgi:D-3-phosphoglycerate dehydrogenase